ncbi:ATP-binding protein [Roseomonas sp. CCTCC AB2023176]|uniref:sensor histidine kinase NtrY-like n=1 Tax=Roseomonas sp. CCTCC AB2023176 TaxID=3342640 RepID=UPI0035DB7049
MTLGLAAGALLVGVATFSLLSGGTPLGPTSPSQIVAVLLVNAAFVLMLGISLTTRLVRVWAERRRGSAGSRLHVRLVLLFGGVAAVPAFLVAAFAAVFFNLGIQAWFSDRVRGTLEASLIASRAYLDEHRNTIRADALAIAAELNRASTLLPDNTVGFSRLLSSLTALRGLTEAVVYDPVLGNVVAGAGLGSALTVDPPPAWANDIIRQGDVAVLADESEQGMVRGVVALDSQPALLLQIGRPVDPSIIEHMQRTELTFQEYAQLDQNRSGLQITFALIFIIAALLVLLAAALIGLVIANQIARPIAHLANAAERVRTGDLSVRVDEGAADDEVGSLSRAFNRMTNQLAAQRSELLEAYRQLDDRRRFTESVLAGVSAGVIGLDPEGRINLPNRSASDLLGRDLDPLVGHHLDDVVPEFGILLTAVMDSPDRARTEEIPVTARGSRRTLLVRIGAEAAEGEVTGYVLTFDDITDLLSAQRQAAWADVARRIAHEIKNPLTPIQLSAERLKRRYLKQITEDPETFRACTDTIVRQVGDIGRMVDEFSAFARMPQPVIRPESAVQLARDALVLQRDAHPDIAYELRVPETAVPIRGDRRLINQALSNLLLNAADAIAMRPDGSAGGRILLEVTAGGRESPVRIAVEDNGIGLPQDAERDRLTEPYVTHKPKGTGLGLAIVKKIMEDHGGGLTLEDGAAGGARAVLFLPADPSAADGPAASGDERGTEMLRHGA